MQRPEFQGSFRGLSGPIRSQKRAQYDQFGHAAFGDGGPFGGGFDFTRDSKMFSAISLVSSLAVTPPRGSRPGEDLRYNLTFSFEEAVSGTEKKVKIPRQGLCENCQATALNPELHRNLSNLPWQRTSKLPTRFFQRFDDLQPMSRPGHHHKRSLTACGGTGRVRKLHTLSIKIPAGVDTGSRLKLRNEGESPPTGGAPGDLYVVIQSGASSDLCARTI